MATTSQSVTAENLLSATVKYSNKDDSARDYDISANVRIENGNVQNFDSGEVKKLSASSENIDGTINIIATFSAYGEKTLNLYLHNSDEQVSQSILSAIYAFMADVKTNVNNTPIQA